MTDRKRTAAERRAQKAMMIDLRKQAAWLDDIELRQRLIPNDWHEMEQLAPTEPEKIRLTIRLDAATVKWFRGLGRGWHGRINEVLRAYRNGVISKTIERSEDRDLGGDLI